MRDNSSLVENSNNINFKFDRNLRGILTRRTIFFEEMQLIGSE